MRVRGVVVGRNRFRVAVDHDGFITILAHGKGRVHAAIVELDALPNAVGATAQHHDLLGVGRLGFALCDATVSGVLVGRIQVGRVGGELGGAGVHALVDRAHLERAARFAHGLFRGLEQLGQTAVGKALLLERVQRGGIECSQGCIALFHCQLVQLKFDLYDLLDLHEEPLVDLGEVEHLVHRQAPMIGTFYRAAGPGKPIFVNVGDELKPGKTICIIEAMKLFNEIESEVTGKIVKVLVDDAKPVEYDQPLFLVDPS